MSYTPPQFVDTKEQAVLALASTIKGEAVTGGDGSVNRALDVLADVLAEQDVQVPQTDAGAILALAQYVSGGGGGDVSTATVTYTLTGGAGDLFVECANGQEIEGSGMCSYPFYQKDGASEGSFTALLYGGKASAYFGDYTVTVVSGDAELEDGEVVITGDCTLSLA